MKVTQITGPTLRGEETKRKEKFKLEALEKENSKTISQKQQKEKKELSTNLTYIKLTQTIAST